MNCERVRFPVGSLHIITTGAGWSWEPPRRVVAKAASGADVAAWTRQEVLDDADKLKSLVFGHLTPLCSRFYSKIYAILAFSSIKCNSLFEHKNTSTKPVKQKNPKQNINTTRKLNILEMESEEVQSLSDSIPVSFTFMCSYYTLWTTLLQLRYSLYCSTAVFDPPFNYEFDFSVL